MRKLIYICLLMLYFSNYVIGQNQTNFWYFGDHAGLDFNSGVPMALTNGMIDTWEGSAVISDTSGNLLFYTDGQKVWNRNHIQMPNGFGLLGDITSTQTALIVQKPNSNNIFYVFTTESFIGPYGLRYSVIDMNLQNGLGDLTSKNILLHPATTEKLTGIAYNNGSQVWIVAHEWNSTKFLSYSISSTGIDTIPIESLIGTNYQLSGGGFGGQMKLSPDGTKLASVLNGYSTIEYYDYNINTGEISNLRNIQVTGAEFYGVEFSPNSNVLYASPYANWATYQLDLSSGNAITISNSAIMIDSSIYDLGALQLGPDGKIYAAVSDFSNGGSNYLNVINNPNQIGYSCNYTDSVIYLAGGKCLLGLPNFIVNNFSSLTSLNEQLNTYKENIQIYPNPSQNVFNIKVTPNNNEEYKVILLNMQGQYINQKQTKVINEVSIYLGDLPKGVYMIRLISNNGKYLSHKLLLE